MPRQGCDRNRAVKTVIRGPIDFAHAAGADGGLDFVWTSAGARLEGHESR